MARQTRSWKHNGKHKKQYSASVGAPWYYFNPYYDPLSDVGINKRNTPFMLDEALADEEE